MSDEQTPAQKIRAAIDYEKPLFDFVRYQLTFLGWAVAVAAIYDPNSSGWQWIFLVPGIAVAIVLNYRLSMLGENLIYLLMEMVFGDRLKYQHPIRVTVTLLFLFSQSMLGLVGFWAVQRALAAHP